MEKLKFLRGIREALEVIVALIVLPLVALGRWDIGGDGIICGGSCMPRSLKILNLIFVICFWLFVFMVVWEGR